MIVSSILNHSPLSVLATPILLMVGKDVRRGVIGLGVDSTCAHLLVKNACLRVVRGPNSRDRWEVTNDSWDISGRG